MNCDKCNKPAVVHELVIRKGKQAEIHLCAEHAAEAGYVVNQHDVPINQILKQFVISHASGESKLSQRRKCSSCGMTMAQFRKGGTLGCPQCYESFVEELGNLIERAQNGATHHLGKRPNQSSDAIGRQLEVRRLTKELNLAVSSEEYEQAARIRDQLTSLQMESDDYGSIQGDDS